MKPLVFSALLLLPTAAHADVICGKDWITFTATYVFNPVKDYTTRGDYTERKSSIISMAKQYHKPDESDNYSLTLIVKGDPEKLFLPSPSDHFSIIECLN